MTQVQILEQLKAGTIDIASATVLLGQLKPVSVDITKPRIQKDGKLCVMPGLTLTAYQLVRTIKAAKELLALAEEQMANAVKSETVTSRARVDAKGKPVPQEDYSKITAGSLLVAYKAEHVEFVKGFFAEKNAAKPMLKVA